MRKRPLPALLICLGFVSFLFTGFAPRAAAQTSVQWLPWAEGMAKAAKENKKILLYVYTSSCGWCKKMETETFQKTEIAQALQEHFIPIKLNANDNVELEFKGKLYRNSNSGPRGYNALATEILDGRMSFPSLVFLDETQQTLQVIAGFKCPDDFLPMAVYYGKDYYKNMPWTTFQKKYAAGMR
jgi:thioredoxin-related protein